LLSSPEYWPGEWNSKKFKYELQATLRTQKVAFQRELTPDSNCSSAIQIDSGISLRLPPPSAFPFAKLISGTPEIKPVDGATLEMVNAGMGTSATRTLHEEVCALRKTSLHYGKHCWASRAVLDIQANMLRLYDDLKKCASQEYSLKDERCRVETHRSQLLGNLTAMISSGVKVLSDVPYTNLIPVLRAMAPGLKVVQTLRGSGDWTEKRVAHNTEDPICKDPKGTNAQSYFDYLGCLNGPTWIGEAFVPQGRMLLSGNTTEKLALRVLGAKYSHHNHLIANTTWPSRLRQLCAWDDDSFEVQIRDTARGLIHGGNVPVFARRKVVEKKDFKKKAIEKKHDSFLLARYPSEIDPSEEETNERRSVGSRFVRS
jgi:hypothetical protein